MTRPIRMSQAASAELYAAVRWYEAQRPGLGAELFDSVNRILNFVESNPWLAQQSLPTPGHADSSSGVSLTKWSIASTQTRS